MQTGEVPKVVANIRRRKRIRKRVVRLCMRGEVAIAFPTRWRNGQLLDANGMELAEQRSGIPTIHDLMAVKADWERERAREAEMARRIAERATPWREDWSSQRRDTGYGSGW